MLLALCAGNSTVIGEFPAQRPVTWSFDAFFDLRLNIRLSKQSLGWWFEMPSCSLWCHCNDVPHYAIYIYSAMTNEQTMLTHKQLKMHGCVLIRLSVPTQLTKYSLYLTNFLQQILHSLWTALENIITFWKNDPVGFFVPAVPGIIFSQW